jgi:protein DJ-1
MPKALILVADGSEEIEFVTPYDVLTRAGFEVKSAGVQLENEHYAHLSRNIRIVPDFPCLLTIPSATAHESYDILILPGGAPGAKTFCNTPAVLEMIAEFQKAGKWVAAICAATTALVATDKAHDVGKKKVTSHPSVKQEVVDAEWEYADEKERVVVDGKVVTSRGPGTALLFALTIVELLCGKGKRDEVAGPMVVAETL